MARLRSIYADYEEEGGHVTKSILLLNSYIIFVFKFFLNNGKNRVNTILLFFLFYHLVD